MIQLLYGDDKSPGDREKKGIRDVVERE